MLERELKLVVDPAFAPSLPPAGTEVTGFEELPALDLRATYYDTPDLRLARYGITLRIRTGEAAPAWTLKLPAGDGIAAGREEVQFDGDARRVPPAAADLVTAFVRSAPLEPVARLRTRRRRWRLHGRGQSDLAELVDDRVSVLQRGGVADRFRELEIEAREIDDEGLARIARAVTRNGAAPADQMPKLVRALGARAMTEPEVPPPTDPRPAEPAGRAVRAALVRGARRIMLNDPRTRLGEVEPLHQMRVGTRRLRSDLRTFRDLVDPAWARELAGELRWLGAALGAVRDLDVLLERLRHASEDLGPHLGALLEDLEARREVARERLLDVLRSQRYVDLLEQLVEGAAAPPLTAAAGQAARDVLPAVAARSWRKAARAGRALDRNSPDEDFHEVRKRTKQARYAAEAVAPALGRRRGEEARAFARRATDVQDVLGELQDAVVAEAAIQQFADVQSRSPQTQFAAGRLLERQRAARSAARDDFAGVWRKLDRPKRRRWM